MSRELDPFNPQDRKEILTQIAKENLLVDETLETRNSDSLDFHDCSVWGVAKALEEAYQLGAQRVASQF